MIHIIKKSFKTFKGRKIFNQTSPKLFLLWERALSPAVANTRWINLSIFRNLTRTKSRYELVIKRSKRLYGSQASMTHKSAKAHMIASVINTFTIYKYSGHVLYKTSCNQCYDICDMLLYSLRVEGKINVLFPQ